MSRKSLKSRVAQRGALVLCLSMIAGCSRIDATRDIRAGAELVSVRESDAPEWLTGAALPTWDGNSSLDERTAVRLAVARSPRVRAAIADVCAARADRVQAGLLPNPVLSVAVGFPIAGSGGPTAVSAGVTQHIASLLAMPGRTREAEQRLRERVLTLGDAAIEAAIRARLGHARVLSAQRRVSTLERVLASSDRIETDTRRRVGAGEESSVDVASASLSRGLRSLELHAARAELAIRKRELLSEMGLARLSAEWSADERDTGVAPTDLTEDDAVRRALEQRLDVLAARAAARAALERAGVEDASRLTDLSVGAAFDRTEENRKQLGPSIEIGVPIFDQGQARVFKADAEAARALAELDAKADEAVLQTRSAFVAWRSAREQLEQDGAAVRRLAREAAELVDRARAAGTASSVDLLRARIAADDAELRVIELEDALKRSLIELRRAMGGSLNVIGDTQKAPTSQPASRPSDASMPS